MTPTKCARCDGSGWITIRRNQVPCVCLKGQQNATIPELRDLIVAVLFPFAVKLLGNSPIAYKACRLAADRFCEVLSPAQINLALNAEEVAK